MTDRISSPPAAPAIPRSSRTFYEPDEIPAHLRQFFEHVEWAPQCQCNAPVRPQVVLDPFSGSGTTWQVCVEEGRDFVGIDLDERAAAWGAARVRKLPVGRLAGV